MEHKIIFGGLTSNLGLPKFQGRKTSWQSSYMYNKGKNKAIRDGRPRPPRHQVGWDIVRRECACQISWWSVEKWRRYYILKFHGNTFRWPTTLTFDLKFWKYLSVTEYPYSMCMLSFMMIGWEMTEILHFEILRKHGQTHKHTNNKHTNTQTHKQTDMGITIPRPPPMGGEVITPSFSYILIYEHMGHNIKTKFRV